MELGRDAKKQKRVWKEEKRSIRTSLETMLALNKLGVSEAVSKILEELLEAHVDFEESEKEE